ncbi:MAG: precorrin-3B synthase [Acetobacteraceae bacterium]|nr:precorrin-3B synthase [Acetobacteraceae bacterium]
MTAIRGWCPSLHEPMQTGDGLLVRVKPPLGLLPAAAARALAAAALEHGNGAIELTGRGALQFRGLSPVSAPRFAAVAVHLGLAAADPAAERRRSVVVSPLAGCDPAVAPATLALARALEAAIVADDALRALPAKFGFAVDGAGALPVGEGADISLVAAGDDWFVVPDGAGAVRVTTEDAVGTALRMAHTFLRQARGERRMRAVAQDVVAVMGLAPEPLARPAPRPPIGPLPGGLIGVGAPFGALDGAALNELAAGDGVLRLTPWRAIILPAARMAAAAALGFIVSPDDPRLLVSACPGQPACASATVDTRGLAARLRPLPGVTVHVSGCSKGCAHPLPAKLTLVGQDGRFAAVRNGRAGDPPLLGGLTPAEAMELQ